MISTQWLRRAVAALALMCSAGAALADYPTKPITLIVPYSAGGGTDIIARLIGAKMSDALGVPVVINNMPGGNTIVGTAAVAHAQPDGYTVLLTTSNLATNEALYKSRPYSLDQLTPVILLTRSPNLLVANPDFPPKNVAEFIAYAKERPGKLRYGSSGVGGTGHLAMEQLSSLTGIQMVHVPYKGGTPALNAVLSGEVPLLFNNIISVMPQVKSGQLRVFGVTSAARSAVDPNIPTIAEAGVPGFEFSAWFGLFVPARTPKEVITRLYETSRKILDDPETQKRLIADGADIVGATPDAFQATLTAEVAKFKDLVAKAGIKPE